MSPLHFANIAMHVAAGTVGLGINFTMLAKAKGTPAHRSARHMDRGNDAQRQSP